MALIENKKARFDYEILETYAAGMELLGFEVKALRGSLGSLEGSHVAVRGGEAYIIGMSIPPYQANNTPDGYDPERTRRLLLNKAEIAELANIEDKKGLTIVPISVYNRDGLLKVDIAVAKGKKKFDKRETLKKRDSDREVRREIADR